MKPSPPSLDAGLPALQQFWNQRYDSDDFAYGTLPNEFLVQALTGVACWDLIVSIFLHVAPPARHRLFGACNVALAPGGRFVYAGFGAEPDEEGRYPALAEIRADQTGCAFEHASAGKHMLNEGRLHVGERLVVHVVARRPGP